MPASTPHNPHPNLSKHGSAENRAKAREEAVAAVIKHRSLVLAAEELGVTRSMVQRLLAEVRAAEPGRLPDVSTRDAWAGVMQTAPNTPAPPQWPLHAASPISEFEVQKLPSSLPTAEELLARRRAEFSRVDAAKQARKLIDVRVNLDGPIGIAHLGDPHCDDAGTNIGLLEEHVKLIKRTEGMLAANIGDQQNLWVGRLGRLYAEQSTSAAESWVLTEWLIRSLRWIYLIGGNHDLWAGAGDPLKWIMEQGSSVHEPHGARLNLKFPNARQVRINARHDFKGHSMWNNTHGIAKAAQMGWRDNILIAGHLHISGYNILKDPASGLISHAIRVASYKTHDRYADQLGLNDSNISECVVTIIDPYAEKERQLVTVFMDPSDAAEFLTWKRAKFFQNRRVNC